ncbi:MAG: phosphoribosyl-ATP diphosphatase, partial [Hyphomicrobiales bacterium]|nr:phosphoribosyl-ATP diphosphatase [Hyphomicrobiales bacterium]
MFDLTELESIIGRRAKDNTEQSYTASLLAKGTNKCAEKFGEEAIETIIAAATQNRDELTAETADVLFHLLVLLKSANIPLSEV